MKMNELIFERFSSVSSKQWKQKIQFELNGADYQKTLINTDRDGIPRLPFYTHEDCLNYILVTLPSKTTISYAIDILNVKEANLKALKAIEKGAEQLFFTLFSSEISIEKLLKNCTVPVIINTHFLNKKFAKQLQKINSPQITLLSDPIGKIAKTGNWYRNFNHDFSEFNETLNLQNNSLSVNASLFQNAGATTVQQLSYTFAQLQDYVVNTDLKTCKSINYKISVTTDFFTEIAKLKAFRILHDAFCNILEIDMECNLIQLKNKRNIQIFNTSLNAEFTQFEYEIGQLGGVDIFVTPNKSIHFFKEDEVAYENLFQQLQVITKNNENTKIYDAIYIEKLTQQLVKQSIELIENIKQSGGFTKQLQKGTIQKKIAEKAKKEQLEFDKKVKIQKPEMKLNPTTFPFFKPEKTTSFWQPIIEKRLAAPQEKQIWNSLYTNE